MKKYLSILVAVLFIATTSSCTKQYVTPNTNQTVFANVKANSWVLSPDGKSYENTILVPALDDQYNDDGAVLVYMSFFDGVYEQLPEVYDGVSYSFYHSRGKIVIYSQTPGAAPVKPTDDVVVKIVLIDSNY